MVEPRRRAPNQRHVKSVCCQPSLPGLDLKLVRGLQLHSAAQHPFLTLVYSCPRTGLSRGFPQNPWCTHNPLLWQFLPWLHMLGLLLRILAPKLWPVPSRHPGLPPSGSVHWPSSWEMRSPFLLASSGLSDFWAGITISYEVSWFLDKG